MKINEDTNFDEEPRVYFKSIIMTVLSFAVFLTFGCSEIKYYVGSRIDSRVLEDTLRVGFSTKSDVRAVLGEPSGSGEVNFPVIDKYERETWSYYFEEGLVTSGSGGVKAHSKRIFVFVYFDSGVYDGYLWFSTFDEVNA